MNHIIQWLLEDDMPHVKYRTMIELQGRTKNDFEVQKAYDHLMNSEMLRLVMDKFQDKNKWEHINAFLCLYEFGLTRQDLSLDDAVERIIKDLNKSMKCSKTLLLRNLVALGYYEHPWVNEQVHLSFLNLREDGTIRCLDTGKKTNDSKLPDMGCYRQTTTYLLLAAELKKKGIILPQFDAITTFYKDHHVIFHKGVAEKWIVKDITQAFFPIDHVNLGIQMILYGLSILGAGTGDHCQRADEILQSYKDSEGKYMLSHSFDKPYFDVGPVGQPNKWVTLYTELYEKYRGDETCK